MSSPAHKSRSGRVRHNTITWTTRKTSRHGTLRTDLQEAASVGPPATTPSSDLSATDTSDASPALYSRVHLQLEHIEQEGVASKMSGEAGNRLCGTGSKELSDAVPQRQNGDVVERPIASDLKSSGTAAAAAATLARECALEKVKGVTMDESAGKARGAEGRERPIRQPSTTCVSLQIR
jgi:hypothetical protein